MKVWEDRRLPVPSKRFLFITWVIAIVLALALGVAGITALIHQSQRIDDLSSSRDTSQRDRADLRSELVEQRDANTALSTQVKSLGQKPVVESGKTGGSSKLPTLIRGLQGKRGPTGPAPSIEAIRKVVAPLIDAAIIASCPPDGKCKGAKGDSVKGDPGKSIQGKPGTNGSDGKDSQVTGPAGKDSTVPGPAGKNAPTPTGVTCTDGSGKFTFTYSDGSTLTAKCSPVTAP